MSRAAYLTGYAAIVLVGVVIERRARHGGRIATLPQSVGRLLGRDPVRLLALAGWLWLGWHLFARAHH